MIRDAKSQCAAHFFFHNYVYSLSLFTCDIGCKKSNVRRAAAEVERLDSVEEKKKGKTEMWDL